MIITHTINMDLANIGRTPQIHVVQGDSCSRCVTVKLASMGTGWTPPEDISVSVRYGKPDGTSGHYDTLPDGTKAWSIQDNAVSVMLAPQMLTVPGRVTAQVEMITENRMLATFSLDIVVEKDPSFGLVKSKDYINWLQRVEDRLDSVLMQAKESGLFDGPPGKDGADGAVGADGQDGVTPNLQIGTVTTLDAGSSATAAISGTTEAPLLNLGIPKGYDIGSESTEYPGCYYRIVDSETEWLNPPLLPGIEYRTTERYNGKPVYVKMVDIGTAATKDVDVTITGIARIIRLETRIAAIVIPYLDTYAYASAYVMTNTAHIILSISDNFALKGENTRCTIYYCKA